MRRRRVPGAAPAALLLMTSASVALTAMTAPPGAAAQGRTPLRQSIFDGGGCSDPPGWRDASGRGCGHYATPAICRAEGRAESNGGMGTAMKTCCACSGVAGGGVAPPPPAPTPQRPPSDSGGGGCSDPPGWKDASGRGCGHYVNIAICRTEGRAESNGGMGTAMKSCCACINGFASPPTPEPAPPLIAETFSPTKPLSSKPTYKPTPPAPSVAPTASAGPTPAPTERDWASILPKLTPGVTSFCGPKLVGGHEAAKATCSFETECGKGAGEASAYGASGNDCKSKRAMCWAGIECVPPTESPSAAPTDGPTRTGGPSPEPSLTESDPPSASGGPTEKGRTRPPTALPTSSLRPTSRSPTASPVARPTIPPADIHGTVTARGSFCGSSFERAVDACAPGTACADDSDCDFGECHRGISCTYHALEDEGAVFDAWGAKADKGDDGSYGDGEGEDGSEEDGERVDGTGKDKPSLAAAGAQEMSNVTAGGPGLAAAVIAMAMAVALLA